MATKTIDEQLREAEALVAKLKKEKENEKEAGRDAAKQAIAALREAHEKALAELVKKQREELDAAVKESGYTPTEMGLRKAPGTRSPATKTTGKRVPLGDRIRGKERAWYAGVEYKHPDNPKSYTGGVRGPVPAWMLEAEKKGNLDDYVVDKSSHAYKEKIRVGAPAGSPRGSV